MTIEQAEKLTADQWARLQGIIELEARVVYMRTNQLKEIADLAAKAEAGMLTADEATHLAGMKRGFAKADELSQEAIVDMRAAVISGQPQQWERNNKAAAMLEQQTREGVA